MRRYQIVFLFLIIGILSGGCASLSRPSKLITEDNIRTVYIPIFKSKAYGTIQEKVTNAVIEEFLADSRLKVIDNKERADAVLEGWIDSYTRAPGAFDGDELPVTENFRIVVSIVLYKPDTPEEPLYEFEDIISEYPAPRDPRRTFYEVKGDAEEQTIQLLAILIVRRVLDQTETGEIVEEGEEQGEEE